MKKTINNSITDIMPEKSKGILSPGDISPGMYVTIHHKKKSPSEDDYYNKESMALFSLITNNIQQDRSGMGVVFKVEAVQLPYVLLTLALNPVGTPPIKLVYDTREIIFMELNKLFMNAYLGKTS